MPNRSKQTPPVVRAGIYTRISWDPEGQRAGVERQRVDCEALCASRGWEIAQYFENNDASAYSGKPRRAYERRLSAVEEGPITGIVTWHNDRLHRSPRELEAFIDLMERSGVRVAVVTGGDYDLTTPEGRFTARIVGAVARKESEDRSRRVRRKHLELAEQGRPAGQLGWGVRSESKRELVREAAQKVLAGQGLMTIARTGTGEVCLGRPSTPGRRQLCARCSSRPAWRAAGARFGPLGKGLGRPDAGDLGGSDRPPDLGPRPVGAAEPREAHPQEHAYEVPVDRLDLLRDLRRPHALPPAR